MFGAPGGGWTFVGNGGKAAAAAGTAGGCAQESIGGATAAGGTADRAPQREGFAESPIVEGTDADGTDEVPLATERLELTPRGFFLNSFNNLSRFE